MKTKRIFSLLICLLIAASFCMGTTAFAAVNDPVISQNNMINSRVYFYEEADMLSQDYKLKIINDLNDTANTTKYRLGVYIGSETRSELQIRSLAIEGAELLHDPEYKENSIFLYLDNSNSEEPYSYMYCIGEAAFYYTDGSNGTEDIKGHIIDEVQNEIKVKSSNGYSNMLYLGLDLYCRELKYYYQKGPAVEMPEEESSADPSLLIYKDKEYRDENVFFYDEPDLFSEGQRKRIVEMLKKASEDIGFNVALYTGGVSRSDREIERIAENNAKSLFEFDKYYGTVFLYIDMDGYSNAYDFMFCAKDAFLYYPNGDDGAEDRIDKILQATETHFPYGGGEIIASEIEEGIKTFCNELRYYKEKGPADNAWYHDDEKGEYVYVSYGQIKHGPVKPYIYWFPMLCIALVAGLITVAIVSATIKKRYQFKNTISASEYTSKNMMIMRDSQDIFLGAHTTKVRMSSSSGGSHGGGGGGHHGGGGGGRHR